MNDGDKIVALTKKDLAMLNGAAILIFAKYANLKEFPIPTEEEALDAIKMCLDTATRHKLGQQPNLN